MNHLTDIEHELRLAAEWALLRCQRAAVAPSEALEAVWRALGVSMLHGSTARKGSFQCQRGSNGFMEIKP